jgi:hypothetical protein
MRKLFIIAASFAALAAPTAAMAGAPDGSWQLKDGAQSEKASSIGKQSSQITQNGQFVSGQPNNYGIDQTTYPGSRADIVHEALGH